MSRPPNAAHELLVNAVHALTPAISRDAAAMEHEQRISDDVLEGLQAMSAFTLQLARQYGGPEADPLTHLRVVEALSRADASVGWCAMVGSESSACINAYLEPAVVRQMLVDVPRAIAALTVVGTGRAVACEGGFRVDGRWRFASACRHATWLGGLCVVYDNDAPRSARDGAPELRLVFVPATDATLLDTWTASGLRATASGDFEVAPVFVPAGRTLDIFGPPRDDRAAWRVPVGLRFALSKAAAVCGIARGAMDALSPLLERTPFAGKRPAREEPRVHLKLARAEAAIEGGRAYLYQNAEQLWRHVCAGSTPSLDDVASARLAVVFAARNAVEAVHLIQSLGGTGAALDPRLDRAVRDLNVAQHHLQLQDHVFEDVGRVLLGLTPNNPMF
ncbi:MAG: acyl-CoA dehydrogenase family protein [Gammaproteobacteria bacterium]|jgi:alkylation response protein AidB-like acyl-CoA dehydrogenase